MTLQFSHNIQGRPDTWMYDRLGFFSYKGGVKFLTVFHQLRCLLCCNSDINSKCLFLSYAYTETHSQPLYYLHLINYALKQNQLILANHMAALQVLFLSAANEAIDRLLGTN